MRTLATLSIAVDLGDAPPTEFCIFKAGANETSKGTFIFDAAAAASVMAAYRQRGTDVMIDLNHESLGPALREDSGDARGWLNLEVRADGSLWAVNVRWTPDGAQRLAEKKQRYISPAFDHTKDGQVLEIVNVAICAMPATYNAPALVAASRALARVTSAATLTASNMDPAQIKAALDAIEAGDSAKAIELLKAIIASAASGGAASAPSNPSPESPTTENADQPPNDPNAPTAASLARELCRVTGRETLAEALAVVGTAVATTATLNADRMALEASQRAELVGELVKLGFETPATAWEGDPKDRKPCARLAAEPVAAMRDRVAKLRASRPAPAPGHTPPPAPVNDDSGSKTFETRHGTVTLSARELDNCTELGAKPEEYAANKAIRENARRK